MKRILLTSTALVAFAGAAAAEVTWSGEATLGYNDVTEGGFYHEVSFGLAGSSELNNGLTAGFSADVTLRGTPVRRAFPYITDYELYLKSDTAGLYFGDTKSAGKKYWTDAAGVNALGLDADQWVNLRGEVTFGNAFVAVSAVPVGAGGHSYQGVVKYDMGNYGLVAGVALKDTNGGPTDTTFGLTGTGSFGGADVTVSYVTRAADKSMGIELGYPVGPVTLGAYYAAHDIATVKYNSYGISADYENGPLTLGGYYDVVSNGATKYGLDASYDVGNGIMIYAGAGNHSVDGNGFYAGAEYDLGGGASALISHANTYGAKIGEEYKEGTTVAVSFEF